MRITKVGRKWEIAGAISGWIKGKQFNAKWKAQLALKVFRGGGRVSDYWKAMRDERRPRPEPRHATKLVMEALEQIRAIDPTCEEIIAFAERAPYDVVTSSKYDEYFDPQFHDTWMEKRDGRVHIDIGCGGYHLMLDKVAAFHFIAFIQERRGIRPTKGRV